MRSKGDWERGRRKKGDQYHMLVMAMDRNSRQHSSAMLLAYAARNNEGRRTGYKRFLSITKSPRKLRQSTSFGFQHKSGTSESKK